MPKPRMKEFRLSFENVRSSVLERAADFRFRVNDAEWRGHPRGSVFLDRWDGRTVRDQPSQDQPPPLHSGVLIFQAHPDGEDLGDPGSPPRGYRNFAELETLFGGLRDEE